MEGNGENLTWFKVISEVLRNYHYYADVPDLKKQFTPKKEIMKLTCTADAMQNILCDQVSWYEGSTPRRRKALLAELLLVLPHLEYGAKRFCISLLVS